MNVAQSPGTVSGQFERDPGFEVDAGFFRLQKKDEKGDDSQNESYDQKKAHWWQVFSDNLGRNLELQAVAEPGKSYFQDSAPVFSLV
jgi:hypothetical protein